MKYFLHILIPAFGESPHIQETISSIYSAGFSHDCKLTVVDDASPTNHIFESTKSFKNKIDYVRNTSNLGVGGNFKKCHELSEGQLTLIIGSDDRLLPGAIEALRDAYRKYPDSIMFQLGTLIIDSNGKVIFPIVDRVKKILSLKSGSTNQVGGKKFIWSLFLGNWLYFPASAWNSRSSTKLNWNSKYQLAVDLDLLLDLAISGEKFCLVSGHHFEYRRHDGSVSSIMIDSGQRLDEELEVHANALRKLPNNLKIKLGPIAFLAPSIRLHAIKAAIGMFKRNPIKAIRLLMKSLSIGFFIGRK